MSKLRIPYTSIGCTVTESQYGFQIEYLNHCFVELFCLMCRHFIHDSSAYFADMNEWLFILYILIK